jgi:hypothetical protein
MNARRLTDEQLDELLHILVHKLHSNRDDTDKDKLREALDKLRDDYPNANHMIEEHVGNMGVNVDDDD